MPARCWQSVPEVVIKLFDLGIGKHLENCGSVFSPTSRGLKVVRQLSVRTVVQWFADLSFEQQTDALAQIQREHEQSRSAKRDELAKQLAALGYGIPKRRGRPTSVSNGAARRNGKKGSVKAKYRDPKTHKTWSGRGRMASWLKSKQDTGEKIDKYLV
jgi:DNA-binding protein H-NS